MQLYLLDYGAGNVTSLANSLKKLGYDFRWIESAEDFDKADVSYDFVSPIYPPKRVSDIDWQRRNSSFQALVPFDPPSTTSSPKIFSNPYRTIWPVGDLTSVYA